MPHPARVGKNPAIRPALHHQVHTLEGDGWAKRLLNPSTTITGTPSVTLAPSSGSEDTKIATRWRAPSHRHAQATTVPGSGGTG
jgi:hypothetical protein